MSREEKIEQLMKESRQIFLEEGKANLNTVLIALLNYILDKSDDKALELERYFHSLNGTGAALHLDKLSALGGEYEACINRARKDNILSDMTILKILEGLALIHENLGELTSDSNDKALTVGEEATDCKDNDYMDTSNRSCPDESLADSRKRILVVDDVNAMVNLIKNQLISSEYEVSVARDGAEAIRKGKSMKPDLMIVDLMLPKADGFEVCRQIKSDSDTKNTKIIIITSKNRKEDVLNCYKVGVDDYIIKPFSLDELEQRVKGLLVGQK